MRFSYLPLFVIASAVLLYGAWVYPKGAVTPIGEEHFIQRGDTQIAWYGSGAGPRIVLLASLGRSVSDFNDLARQLNDAGFRTVAVESRGVRNSKLKAKSDLTLYALAKDVAAVLEADNLDKGDTVHVVGHAFGNRVARAFAHQYPDTVNKIVLVASGGAQNLREMPDVLEALTGSFKWWTPPPIRKSNVHFAFFADEHPVPPDWMRGWYIEAMKAQSRAVALTPEAEWRAAGGHAPILVLQGGDDRVAPAALTSESLRADYPDRVSIKVIPNAGHALLPEAPDDIANAIIAFLSTQKAEPR